MTDLSHHPTSFKDPAGFIFYDNGFYFRQINESYRAQYELLMGSGLYAALTGKNLLLPHEEIDKKLDNSPDWFKTLLPRQLTFTSYPYEWSFDQLKDAALLTLRIVCISVEYGMILKDATGFNVQYQDGRPIFIDTLSFEKYDPSTPWIAYRQFCECFLFPLFLEHYLQVDVQKLLSVHLEGIPVRTTAALLPGKSRFKLSVWLHVYLQNAVGPGKGKHNRPVHFTKEKLLRLINHLETTIKTLHVNPSAVTTWNNYYQETILGADYLREKSSLFRSLLVGVKATRALDLGCNDGYFSLIIAEHADTVVSVDADSQCINKLYLSQRGNKKCQLFPICIDLSNPSAALGFRNAERESFVARAASGLVVALALLHHLVLSKNIPLTTVARQLAELSTRYLIIEFVPIEDEKAQALVRNKKTYHMPYDAPAFEKHFSFYFEIEKKEMIPGTARILYRMIKIVPTEPSLMVP